MAGLARTTRATVGVAAVAAVSAVMSFLSNGIGRVAFSVVGLLASGFAAAMLYKPGFFFDEDPKAIPTPRGLGSRENTHPLPISLFEWTVFVIGACLAAVITAAIAGSSSLVGVFIQAGLAGYCYAAGRLGLRRGYDYGDRFMLLLGELLGVAVVAGLILRIAL